MTDTPLLPFGTYAATGLPARFLSAAQHMPVNGLGRRLALVCRKITLSLISSPLVDACVDGLSLRLHMDDNVSERKFLFMPQFFDRFERAQLKKILKPGDVFVDIGANAGIYSMTAAACVGAEGHVLAVEPNPVATQRLQTNAALNGFTDRIIVAPYGISDSQGSFDLFLDSTNLGGSSLVGEKLGAGAIRVTCIPLLDLLQQHNITSVAALKIDIEGAEDKALIPFLTDAPDALLPNLMIIENSVDRWKDDVLSMLAARGYTKIAATKMNLVYQR